MLWLFGSLAAFVVLVVLAVVVDRRRRGGTGRLGSRTSDAPYSADNAASFTQHVGGEGHPGN